MKTPVSVSFLLTALTQQLCVCVLVLPAEDQISVKVTESGWAWMVCGERLIIWKICQTAVAKVESPLWFQWQETHIKAAYLSPTARV